MHYNVGKFTGKWYEIMINQGHRQYAGCVLVERGVKKKYMRQTYTTIYNWTNRTVK